METSPPFKTFIYSNVRSCRGTYSTATSFTLLLIPGTPGTTSSTTTTSAGMENIRVYLAITFPTHVNIVCKQVAKIVKDI